MGLKNKKKTKEQTKNEESQGKPINLQGKIKQIEQQHTIDQPQIQQDNTKYDAFPEDLMFLHTYDNKLYGYRQNKCFCFSKLTLELIDVFDVDFPDSFYPGCPILQNKTNFYGINPNSNTIYNFHAHSIHELSQIVGNIYFNLQCRQYQYACIYDGFLLFNSQNNNFMHITVQQNSIEYKLVNLRLIGNSFEMIRADYNYILIINTQAPQQLYIYDIQKQTILNASLHIPNFNNTLCLQAKIVLFYNNILILSLKTYNQQQKLLLIEIQQLPNKCTFHWQINHDQHNQLENGLIVELSGINMLLSPYVTDSKYRKSVFSEVLYKVFGAQIVINEQQCNMPSKKSTELYNDQQFKDLLLETDYQTEYNKIKTENQQQEINQLKAIVQSQNNRISKLEKDNMLLQEMFKQQQNVNEQMAKEIHLLNLKLKHGNI